MKKNKAFFSEILLKWIRFFVWIDRVIILLFFLNLRVTKCRIIVMSMWTIYHYCLCLASEEKKVHITRRWNYLFVMLSIAIVWKTSLHERIIIGERRKQWRGDGFGCECLVLQSKRAEKVPKCSFPILYNSLPFITPQTRNYAQRCQWRFSHSCDDFLRDELFRICCRAI